MLSWVIPYFPEILSFFVAAWAQVYLARSVRAWPGVAGRSWAVRAVTALMWLLVLWVGVGLLFQVHKLGRALPDWPWIALVRGTGITWGIGTTGVAVVLAVFRALPPFHPERRRLLLALRAVALTAPVAATGFGVFIQRREFRIREVDLVVPGLPADLAGLRIAQLSDIHLGPFLSTADLARVVGMANETRPQLTVVTGDLVTIRHDPLEECLRELSKLRADSGIWGCLGNHEIYAEAEEYAARRGARFGIRFLRQQHETLRFGKASMRLAGVDYQPFRRPYLTAGPRLLDPTPGTLNVLLSHNPDVFPVAARQGFDITLAGHTHGGQINVEILNENLNPARFFTRYIYGVYQMPKPKGGTASLYVTRGVGTVGVPARLGAPPEVAVIRLCATSS